LVDKMLEASGRLDAAQRELEDRVREQADAEAHYRLTKSLIYLETEGTVAEREALVDRRITGERRDAHLAEGLAKSALEAVRNRRVQLSCLQTVSNAVREEMAFAKTGPGP
jgi:hypothetical protein